MKSFSSSSNKTGSIFTNRQPVVALLSSTLGANLYYEKWYLHYGISQTLRQHQIHLISIVGGENTPENPNAVLYDLITSDRLDGIIIWSGTAYPKLNAKASFFNRFSSLPIVNIGWEVPGIPSLAFNHYQGMYDLVVHLVEQHGYQKIASAGKHLDHPGFMQRFDGYKDALQRFGLFNSRLVADDFPGYPLKPLDERGLLPGIDYQAIIGMTDDTAHEVMNNLLQRGLRIPVDVAVTGFHDGQIASITNPPLTSVRLPFSEIGKRAAEWMIDLLNDKSVPNLELIPLPLITRQSCGCFPQSVIQAANQNSQPTSASLHTVLADKASAWVQEIGVEWIDTWINSFTQSIALPIEKYTPLQSNPFLMFINEIVNHVTNRGLDPLILQSIISIHRQNLLPILKNPARRTAENLWQQARVQINQATAWFQQTNNWRLIQQTEILQQIDSALHTTFDIEDLIQILVKNLDALGIQSFYLVLYDDIHKPTGTAHLKLVYDQGQRLLLPPDGEQFTSTEIIPSAYLSKDKAINFYLASLYYRQEQIGFILIGPKPTSSIEVQIAIETLRSQISGALKGIDLHRKIQEAQTRAEEANELKSRFLSMVSHELRTPLNLIVSLCQVASWQKNNQGKTSSKKLLIQLQEYQSKIHASAQHLNRLISDVLDLASSQVGQLRLVREPIDLRSVLEETSNMGKQMAESKSLGWKTNFPAYLPFVSADRTRLRQIILNLLSNAVKFTSHGEVCLSAEISGEYILIVVNDTGMGVPLNEQDIIFDEFQQSERTAIRGFGGIGLGLAITRQLVELHGGKIGVQSSGKEGEGSAFFFSLPILATQISPDTDPLLLNHQPVLLLSNDQTSRIALENQLQDSGFSVIGSSLKSLEEQFREILAIKPGAIVLDCQFSTEDDWKIVKLLKEHPSTHDIPLVFFALIEELNSGGVLALDWMTKPIQKHDLVQTLDHFGLRAGSNLKQPTILIVDDDPDIIAVNAEIIRIYVPLSHIITAYNGLEALEIIKANQPNLVLLDLIMPEMDGFTVVERLQTDPILKNIPVVILTGQILTSRELSRLNRGVVSIMNKGFFSKEETFSQIQTALKRERRLGSDTQRLVRQAMGYIHENFGEPLNRSEIAKKLNLDEDYLTRCFSQETGLSLVAYLNRYRILQAKHLLEKSGLRIGDISQEVGFSSQSYFSRIFERQVGMSPSDYRSDTLLSKKSSTKS
jgi:signal transduction histidine kinase/DNA-binding LacI/PurR family transcriptional regulator/AraC-like DNA-binding protein